MEKQFKPKLYSEAQENMKSRFSVKLLKTNALSQSNSIGALKPKRRQIRILKKPKAEVEPPNEDQANLKIDSIPQTTKNRAQYQIQNKREIMEQTKEFIKRNKKNPAILFFNTEEEVNTDENLLPNFEILGDKIVQECL